MKISRFSNNPAIYQLYTWSSPIFQLVAYSNMPHLALLLLVLIGAAVDGGQVNLSLREFKTELQGFKRLVKDFLPDGVYLTCEIALFSKIVDFHEADLACKNFTLGWGYSQGNLVTIANANKTAALKVLLEMAYPKVDYPSKWGSERWTWAGLRKIDNLDKKNGYVEDDWQWSNGENPGDYEKWMNKMPDAKKLKYGKSGCDEKPYCWQHQMRANHDGVWDDSYTFKTHPYACDYQGKYVVSGVHRTWEGAREHCATAGLTLAKIRNKSELAEFLRVADVFLGPRDTTLSTWTAANWIWLGGTDLNEEGEWEWVDDGVEVDADWDIPWKVKAGNDNASYLGPFRKTGQDALAVSRWGTFDDSYVGVRKRPFGCQCRGTITAWRHSHLVRSPHIGDGSLYTLIMTGPIYLVRLFELNQISKVSFLLKYSKSSSNIAGISSHCAFSPNILIR
eukprot:sb/3464635/